MRHLIPEVVICYPELVEPKEFMGRRRWSVCALFNKSDDQATEKFKAAQQAIVETINAGTHGKPMEYFTVDKLPIQDGAKVDKKTNAKEFADSMIIKAYTQENQGRPECFENYDRKKLIPIEEIGKRFVNGTIANVVIDFFISTNENIVRVCCGLAGMQFVEVGTPFGPGTLIPEAVFQNYDTDIKSDQLPETESSLQVTQETSSSLPI